MKNGKIKKADRKFGMDNKSLDMNMETESEKWKIGNGKEKMEMEDGKRE